MFGLWFFHLHADELEAGQPERSKRQLRPFSLSILSARITHETFRTYDNHACICWQEWPLVKWVRWGKWVNTTALQLLTDRYQQQAWPQPLPPQLPSRTPCPDLGHLHRWASLRRAGPLLHRRGRRVTSDAYDISRVLFNVALLAFRTNHILCLQSRPAQPLFARPISRPYRVLRNFGPSHNWNPPQMASYLRMMDYISVNPRWKISLRALSLLTGHASFLTLGHLWRGVCVANTREVIFTLPASFFSPGCDEVLIVNWACSQYKSAEFNKGGLWIDMTHYGL